MKGINDFIWSFENETQGTPGVSMNACCGGGIPYPPSDSDPGRGTGKPPIITEK